MNAKNIISTFIFLVFVSGSDGFSSVSKIIGEGIDGACIPLLSPIPAKVAGCHSVIFNLDGKWKFNPAATAHFYIENTGTWSDIQVPSEWVMQGFTVLPNAKAAYSRTFSVPSDWTGKRIKLRCNAIYSDAVVYVNGQLAGQHSGGFTPFEIDITNLVQPNTVDTLAISVLNETKADSLASASGYACHQLGGITRSIGLFAVPAINFSSVQVKTSFDSTYTDAILGISLEASKDAAVTASDIEAQLSLTDPNGNDVYLSTNTISLNSLKATLNLNINKPLKWDNEHPNLYSLSIKLFADGQFIETLIQKVGFRQIEVKGNEMFVNGMPVKLHGCNHHEVYPTTGRSLPAGMHLKDILLFREGNVNLLRTCHYPPDEALMNAADSLGMFIECEAPFCWVRVQGNKNLICRQSAEMVLTFRNHPSVLFWSIANESIWGKDFEASSQLIRQLDPTRPQVFNHDNQDIKTSEGFAEIANLHYAGYNGPVQAKQYNVRPLYQGENCHLNAYNRLELATDPGLRETWGQYLREMWDDIDSTKGCLGQSIWSGIDDTFYLPNGDVNGYGTWGPLDGWRRPKPEYWGMKKGYSPVRILNSDSVRLVDNRIVLTVQNRQNFSNLSEMKIKWAIGSQTGVASAFIDPGSTGNLIINLLSDPEAGERLAILFIDPRGFVADEYNLSISGKNLNVSKSPPNSKTSFTETAHIISVNSGSTCWKISKKTGQLVFVNDIPLSGPQLMILALNNTGETQMTGKEKVWTPFTEPCTNWACTQVIVNSKPDTVSIQLQGKYAEASGAYTLVFANEQIKVKYDFTVIETINPRQVGVVFSLPPSFERFSWERKGYWDVYPEDHIARLIGTVTATEGFASTPVGPRTLPVHPWRLDNLPYGNNDFCSTKNNVLKASLTDKSGKGLEIEGQGKQHVRCWLKNEVFILVADYSNGGSERFLQGFTNSQFHPLKVGDKISGIVNVSALNK